MAVAPVATSFGFGSNTSSGGNMPGSPANNATSVTFNYTATTSGNVVSFWVAMVPASTSPTTCSLSATGWAFTQIGGIVDGGTSSGCGAMFRAYAPNTSAATITMTWNQAVGTTTRWMSNLIGECSGMDTTSPVAGNNSATGSGTPTVSITPTANDCLVLVFCNDSITAVGSIGGSVATKGADDAQGDWSENRLVSGQLGISQTCTITGSGSYIIGAVAIQPQTVGPTIGSVPSGTALTTPAFSAKFLFFDTGDYGIGV